MVLGSVLASVARRAPRGAAGAPRILQAPICTSGVRTAPAKPSIHSIGELRRAVPGTSMIKAREALLATRAPDAPDTDRVAQAIEWLNRDREEEGARRAAKVAGRRTAEGIVAISTLGDGLPPGAHATEARAGIIELNCETDFVARNELFGALARSIVHTVAWYPMFAQDDGSGLPVRDVDVEGLLDCPLVPYDALAAGAGADAPVLTVRAAIVDVVSRLGEKVSLARAATLYPTRDTAHISSFGAFAHGMGASLPQAAGGGSRAGFVSGKVGSLVLARLGGDLLQVGAEDEALLRVTRALLRSLARQAAGFRTTSLDKSEDAESDVSTALLEQPFAMALPSAGVSEDAAERPVSEVLRAWGSEHAHAADCVRVAALRRWEVGETAAPAEDAAASFADEVKKAAGVQ